MRLVYLSPVPWHSFSQRPHKFVEWYHNRTGGPVLWIDPYPTRFPQWSDWKRVLTRSTTTDSGNASPFSWIKVLQPGGLPIEPIPGSDWVNQKLWRHVIAAIHEFTAKGNSLLAIGKPSGLAQLLLQQLSPCPSLYDAMDDFPAFYTGFSRRALTKNELLIAQRVDIIWASSTKLQAHWQRHRPDVCLVNNGLDLAGMPAPTLSSSSPSTKKVFGYVGTMAAWFDWDWVTALANSRADDEIRLIGPLFKSPTKKLPNNIRLLPPCEHAAALKAMLEFDVGLIPFKKNVLTASVDPIKYYEYRALALPVISTDFGEMQLRSKAPGVFISQSEHDVGHMVQKALNHERDVEQARAFALVNSWQTRFDTAKLLP